MNKADANTLVFQLAHEAFKIPGDPNFALGGLLTAPGDKQEEGAVYSRMWHEPCCLFLIMCCFLCAAAVRLYLRQCREQAGERLVERCFGNDAVPSKYWLAFAQKKFLNKMLA